jgi:hypothetical protein
MQRRIRPASIADGGYADAGDRPFDVDGAAVGVEVAGIVQGAGDEQRA